jgi:hypothetical protein
MTDKLTATSALATLLESRLMEWDRARKPQELKMLECYQDVMRIPREDDTVGTGAARSRKAKGLFIGSTRNKVRAARAKINDALFGTGKLPFDTEPTNEKMAPFADAVEDILTDQLERMRFREMLSTGVNTLATYGTGFLFGPFVRQETLTETMADSGQIAEQKYQFDLPYFELGNSLDVYPDPEAREIRDGLGVFWTTMESPHTVKAWKADKRYQNIDDALVGSADNGNETGSERAVQLRGNVEYWFKNDRIKVARFFGKVPKSALSDSPEDSGEMVDVIAVMAGGVVVKLDENPYGGKNPAHRCVYEAVEHEIWGVGVAENNAPHQKVTNAAFRLFMEGKGMALLGTKAVDRSNFLPTENFQKFPGKVYQFKPGLSAEEKKASIIEFNEQDVTNGWLDVIHMSEQFSDDDTGITKYTQGDDSSHLNKTAAGISMIMGASSLPIKEVIQNIDLMWIEPVIECLIDWNLKYLEPETVQKIHGDEVAQLWMQIKQFGKSSFLEWKATGTASFMQKEVLTQKLQTFSAFALGNPATAQLIDARELLEQTWDVLQIGKESPVLKDDNSKIPPQIQQQMQQHQQMIQQLDQTVQKMSAELESKEQKDANDSRKLDIEWFKAQTDRMAAEANAAKNLATPGAANEIEEVKQMLLDVMHAIKNPAHLDDLPAPSEMQNEADEPQPEAQEPSGQPEPTSEQQEPTEPPSGGFFSPEDQQ